MPTTLLSKDLVFGQWKRLSLAGQNGKAWVKNTGNDTGKCKVLIAHADTTQTPTDNIPIGAALNLDKEISYTVPNSGDPMDSEILSASNANDIYYATLRNDVTGVKLTVDFV